MIFGTMRPSWTGIRYDAGEGMLPELKLDAKIYNRVTSYKIVRFTSPYIELIINGGFNIENIYNTKPIADLSTEFAIAKSNKVGEYPVLVCINDDAIINVVVKDTDWFESNLNTIMRVLGFVLGCDNATAVTEMPPIDVFEEYMKTHKFSVNSLYIPTHDCTPALWMCTPHYTEAKPLRINGAFSTEEVKTWFNIYAKSIGDILEAGEIYAKCGEAIAFMYNKSYQHFNGSLSYNVLLYPVFVRLWETLYQRDYDFFKANYENWRAWCQSGGELPAIFKEPERVTQDAISTALSEDYLGVWERTEIEPNNVHLMPPGCGELNQEIFSSLLAMRAAKGGDVQFQVYVNSKDEIHTWVFKPAEGVRVLGNSTDIARLFIAAIEADKVYDLQKDYVLK